MIGIWAKLSMGDDKMSSESRLVDGCQRGGDRVAGWVARWVAWHSLTLASPWFSSPAQPFIALHGRLSIVSVYFASYHVQLR